MAGPIKRSIMVAGHATSITLEAIFWDALKEAAVAKQVPISALVAQIDVDRLSDPQPANLASAIRTWLYLRLKQANAETI